MAPRRFHLRVAAEEQHLAEIRDFLQEVGEKLLIPRRGPGKDQPRRTLRFTYTVQAFGAITLIVALAFGAIHLRQIGGLEEEVLAQARASAASLAGSGLDVLLRKEPMSVEQTLLNQS